VTRWSTKTPLFDYLHGVSKSDAVKIVVVKDQPGRHPCREYTDFYDLIIKGITEVRKPNPHQYLQA
jgi:hypothetical protein